MPDTTQDFNIKVVTTADTTGIRQTSAELDKLKNQQAMFAETARRQAASAAAAPQAPAGGGAAVGSGLSGTAAGVGTIVLALGAAWREWQKFQEELDKAAEAMIRSQEKMRALGESILDIQADAQQLARIGTEPLEQSFSRLQNEIAVLKTEMSLLNLPSQGEEWKKLNKDVAAHEALLNRVTSAIERQAAAEEKARQKQVESQEKAYGAASPQAKLILENEKRAREAKAAGDEKSAEQYQGAADQLRKSASPSDLAGVQAVSDAYGKAPRPGRAAGVGESQDLVDEMERNRIAAEEQNKLLDRSQPEIQQPLTNPPPNEDMTATPRDTYKAGDKTIGAQGADIIKAIVSLEKTILSIWR